MYIGKFEMHKKTTFLKRAWQIKS